MRAPILLVLAAAVGGAVAAAHRVGLLARLGRGTAVRSVRAPR